MSTEEGTPKEIVIDHVSRFLSKMFAVIGLIVSIVAFVLYFAFGYCIPLRGSDSPFDTIAGATLIAVFSILSLYSLCADKPFLETSDDGLMVSGLIRWYCPWSNVRDITVVGVGKRLVNNFIIPTQRTSIPQLVIDVHASEKVLYDNRLHSFLAGLVIKKDRLVIELAGRTSMTQEKVCELLRARWQLATDSNQKSRA